MESSWKGPKVLLWIRSVKGKTSMNVLVGMTGLFFCLFSSWLFHAARM